MGVLGIRESILAFTLVSRIMINTYSRLLSVDMLTFWTVEELKEGRKQAPSNFRVIQEMIF